MIQISYKYDNTQRTRFEKMLHNIIILSKAKKTTDFQDVDIVMHIKIDKNLNLFNVTKTVRDEIFKKCRRFMIVSFKAKRHL